MRQLLALWKTHGGIFCVLNGKLSPSWFRISLPSVQGFSTCRAHWCWVLPQSGWSPRVSDPVSRAWAREFACPTGHRFCGCCHSMDHTTSSFILVCLRVFQIFQDGEWVLYFFPQSPLLQVKHVRLLAFPYSMSDSAPSSEYLKTENI